MKTIETSLGVGGFFNRLSRWLEREDPLQNHQNLRLLFESSLQETAANQLAIQWADHYRHATDDERLILLVVLTETYLSLEAQEVLITRLFRRLYAQSNCLLLMLMLRADLLRWHNQIEGSQALEHGLARLLINWFEIGMLELRPITWDSSASLLEKLIQYEAVHEIHSWEDMKRRVAIDRRCYAFFHPRMLEIPLIFVEVALAEKMATQVQDLLDPISPVAEQLEKTRWAIFYSISNTQRGLDGISFGNSLLQRVIETLLKELPTLRSFATLSPIPGFSKWLLSLSNHELCDYLSEGKQPKKECSAKDLNAQLCSAALLDSNETIQRQGLRLAAHYLRLLENGRPVDPVARFHLGNGASIGRINWAADVSEKGIKQSCGMMVNYQYEPSQLDINRLHLASGKPRTAKKVQRLL